MHPRGSGTFPETNAVAALPGICCWLLLAGARGVLGYGGSSRATFCAGKTQSLKHVAKTLEMGSKALLKLFVWGFLFSGVLVFIFFFF